MTSSSEAFAPNSTEPTTVLPGLIDVDMLLPELTSPQERYDNGFKRGYMAGYTEGARQAEAERAADLATQKANWAATQARASALVSKLGAGTEEYLANFAARDGALTEQLISAAFELAAAVVNCEVRCRPDLALDVARNVLASLPTGPAVIRVNPVDAPLFSPTAGLNAVTVVADPAVGAGGCTVTSGAKTVDARIEHALARAREAFCRAGPDAPDHGTDNGTGDGNGAGNDHRMAP